MGSRSDLDGCGSFIKYTLFFFNFIVFILGLAVTGLGIWTVVDNAQVQKIMNENLYIPAASVLIAFGIIVALISFLGCCGAIKEVKCLLGLFFVIMLVLTILIAMGAIFAFVVKGKLDDGLVDAMKETMKLYGDEREDQKEMKEAWNSIQKELKCCGASGAIDWNVANPALFPDGKLPDSCCKSGTTTCNLKTPAADLYSHGCYQAVKDLVMKHATPLAAVGISIAVIIILSMIFSCALCLMI